MDLTQLLRVFEVEKPVAHVEQVPLSLKVVQLVIL
jgi:hypothetical protein